MKYIIPILGLILMGGGCYLAARGGNGVEAIAITVGNTLWIMGAQRGNQEKALCKSQGMG